MVLPVGEYVLESGSFDEIPEAPAWLLAMMTNAKPKEGWISKGRTMRLTDRSEDDSARMIAECFSVIPPPLGARILFRLGEAWYGCPFRVA